MRIRMFGKLIEVENLKAHVLKDTAVVVDAQNFFYSQYKTSGLQYIFGCESDKYATFLRDYLSMFKKANVKCYFIFKGGHEDIKKRLAKVKTNELRGRDFDINKEYDEIVLPVFAKNVCKQVLDEMGFYFTYCEYESKKECIALAQELQCPVISYDIEFCFSGLPYIMQSTLNFDELKNQIKCGIFSLDDFLRKNQLTEEKLSFFVALTDENEFPQNHFQDFIMSLGILSLGNFKRNLGILKWLARNTVPKASEKLFQYISTKDKTDFLEVEKKIMELTRRREEMGIAALYLKNGQQIEIKEKDEFWFQKGAASKYISTQIINLARADIVEGSSAISDYNDEDARLLSIDVLKYIYNLLTNFEKDELTFCVNKQEIPISVKNTIQKPEYDGISSPFENGWKHLKGELFEHFLTETLQGFDVKEINKLPEDVRMLMTALIYFSDKKPADTKNEVCSILLSYIALGVVSEAKRNNDSKDKASTSPTELNEYFINEQDQLIAKGALAKYLADVKRQEAKRIFDVKLLHPLVQFQYCFQSLNHLNLLCGKLFEPTNYSKTYNGTFVYKVLHTIKTEYVGDVKKFLQQELNSAPTALAFIQKLMKVHGEIVDSK